VADFLVTQGGIFTYSTGGTVDSAGSLEVWKSDLRLLAYRIQIRDNPAHTQVISDL